MQAKAKNYLIKNYPPENPRCAVLIVQSGKLKREKNYEILILRVKMLNKIMRFNTSGAFHEWMDIIKYLNLKTSLAGPQNCLVSVFQDEPFLHHRQQQTA